MSEFDMSPKEIAKRLTTDERISRVGQEVGLTARQANAITMARLQSALSDLADGKVQKVSLWLDQVGERSPAEAIRLFMELLEFRMPRLKAAQVVANLTPDSNPAGARRLTEMTMAELERVIAEG